MLLTVSTAATKALGQGIVHDSKFEEITEKTFITAGEEGDRASFEQLWDVCQDDPDICQYLDTILAQVNNVKDSDTALLPRKEVKLTNKELMGESSLMQDSDEEDVEAPASSDGVQTSGISAKMRLPLFNEQIINLFNLSWCEPLPEIFCDQTLSEVHRVFFESECKALPVFTMVSAEAGRSCPPAHNEKKYVGTLSESVFTRVLVSTWADGLRPERQESLHQYLLGGSLRRGTSPTDIMQEVGDKLFNCSVLDALQLSLHPTLTEYEKPLTTDMFLFNAFDYMARGRWVMFFSAHCFPRLNRRACRAPQGRTPALSQVRDVRRDRAGPDVRRPLPRNLGAADRAAWRQRAEACRVARARARAAHLEAEDAALRRPSDDGRRAHRQRRSR